MPVGDPVKFGSASRCMLPWIVGATPGEGYVHDMYKVANVPVGHQVRQT